MKKQFRPKYHQNYFWISALIFLQLPGGFLEAFWASCRLPYLCYYLLSPQEAQKASRKPAGSHKKFQGRKPETISLVFWMKLIFHKDILKLTEWNVAILKNLNIILSVAQQTFVPSCLLPFKNILKKSPNVFQFSTKVCV